MSSQAGQFFRDVPKHVVVPLSHHWDSRRAVAVATWLAHRAGAPMLLRAAVADSTFVGERRAELEELADQLRGEGLVVDTFVHCTLDPGEFILEEARNHAGSIICMPSNGPGRLAEFALGTVTQQVVTGATGPVLLVGPHVVPGPVDVETLVAGVDGSAASAGVIPVVGAWAVAFGLGIELVEVVSEETERVLATPGLRGDVLEAADLLHGASTLRVLGLDPDWETLHGPDPGDALVQHVRDRPGSLLVVGTHGRGGVSRLVLGSVAMRLVHRSPVPVVVVR